MKKPLLLSLLVIFICAKAFSAPCFLPMQSLPRKKRGERVVYLRFNRKYAATPITAATATAAMIATSVVKNPVTGSSVSTGSSTGSSGSIGVDAAAAGPTVRYVDSVEP